MHGIHSSNDVGAWPSAGLTLPLRWRAVVDLPTLGQALSTRLEWPLQGPPLLVCERHDLPWSEATAAGWGPELAFVEVSDARALSEVAVAAARDDVEVVAFVSPSIPEQARAVAKAIRPSMALVTRTGRPREDVGRAAQFTAELVRRRAFRELLAGWLSRLRAQEAALATLDPVAQVDREVPPAYASWEAIEAAHVLAMTGLWFTAPQKVASGLELSSVTWRARVKRANARLQAVRAAALKGPHVKVLVVEADRDVVRLVDRVLERRTGTRARGFEVKVVSSGAEACRWIERSGAPDLLWVDLALAHDDAGCDLVSWLRTRGSRPVVVARVSGASVLVPRLSAMGVALVWGDASEVPEGQGPLESQALDVMRRVRGRAAGAATMRQVTAMVARAEAELAPMPHGVGCKGVPLEDVRAEAVREAMALAGGVREGAGRLLGVSVKSLNGLAPALVASASP